MKIVMTLRARDEEDVVEANLLFHRNLGVDFIIALDHGSVDATPTILEHYARQGWVHVIREDGHFGEHYRRVTDMARMACDRFGADWVINNDADEFWWPNSGSLKTALAQVPEQCGVYRVQRWNFVARPDGPGPFYERLLWRETHSLNYGGKPLKPKVCHRAVNDVEVFRGNHRVHSPSLGPVYEGDLIDILHFPHRSYSQFDRKFTFQGVSPGDCHRRDISQNISMGKGRKIYSRLIVSDERLPHAVLRGRLTLDRRLQMFFQSKSRIMMHRPLRQAG